MGTVNPCGSNLLVKNRFGRRSLRVWFSQGVPTRNQRVSSPKTRDQRKKISSTMTEFVSPGAPGNELQFLDPLFELWANPVVREKLEETGRLWWSNSDITVNLWWSLAAVLLGVATLLLFMWLLGFDVLSSSTGSGYGLAYRSDNDVIGELHSRVSALEESEAALRDTYGSPYSSYDVSGSASAASTDNVSYGS